MSRRVGLAGLAGVLNDIYMGEELRMGKKLWMEKKYTRKQISTQKRVHTERDTCGAELRTGKSYARRSYALAAII